MLFVPRSADTRTLPSTTATSILPSRTRTLNSVPSTVTVPDARRHDEWSSGLPDAEEGLSLQGHAARVAAGSSLDGQRGRMVDLNLAPVGQVQGRLLAAQSFIGSALAIGCAKDQGDHDQSSDEPQAQCRAEHPGEPCLLPRWGRLTPAADGGAQKTPLPVRVGIH